MGKINGQIPNRNFELIRDAICSILATELPDQNDSSDITKVWKDRSMPFDSSELPTVNVSYDNSGFDNQNPISKEATNQYFIDIHILSKHSTIEQGDTLSSLTAQRIAGIVDYILSSGEYYYLDFEPGIIASRWVNAINIGKATSEDSLNIIVARVTFNVRANENVNDLLGVPLSIASSQVKLNETDKGHYFELNSDAISEFTEETIFTDNTVFV